MTAAPKSASNTERLQSPDIQVPCTESWGAMQGDDRVRHCGLCKKNVYNLSAMPQAEAASVLARNVDGALCVRFYRRSDGTVMTSDCSASPRVKLHHAVRTLPRMAAGVAGAVAVAAAVAHAVPQQPEQRKQPEHARSGPLAMVALISSDSGTRQTVTMGAPPATPPPEQATRTLHDGEREPAQ